MAFGVSMETEEIHPQLGKLAEDGFVFLRVPPVGAFRKIMEGMDAAEPEERPAGLIKRRDL